MSVEINWEYCDFDDVSYRIHPEHRPQIFNEDLGEWQDLTFGVDCAKIKRDTVIFHQRRFFLSESLLKDIGHRFPHPGELELEKQDQHRIEGCDKTDVDNVSE